MQRFLGHFVTDLEAARAYDKAMLDLRGPDGRTNFPLALYAMEGDTGADAGGRAASAPSWKGVGSQGHKYEASVLVHA